MNTDDHGTPFSFIYRVYPRLSVVEDSRVDTRCSSVALYSTERRRRKKRMRAALESLLRARKLDVTLIWAAPGPGGAAADRLAATGLPDLDAALGGGLRRGQLSEIAGAPSSGRSTLAARALAAAVDPRRGGRVNRHLRHVWNPASAGPCLGFNLSGLLWVRETGNPLRALKAFSLVLQAGGFGLVHSQSRRCSATGVAPLPVSEPGCAPRAHRRRQRDRGDVRRRRAYRAQRRRGDGCARREGTRAAVEWAGSNARNRRLQGLTIRPRVISVRTIGAAASTPRVRTSAG